MYTEQNACELVIVPGVCALPTSCECYAAMQAVYLVLVGAGDHVHLLLLDLLLAHGPLPHAHRDLVVRQRVPVLNSRC